MKVKVQLKPIKYNGTMNPENISKRPAHLGDKKLYWYCQIRSIIFFFIIIIINKRNIIKNAKRNQVHRVYTRGVSKTEKKKKEQENHES